MDIVTEILLEGYDIIEIKERCYEKIQLERLLNGYLLSEDKSYYLSNVAAGVFNEWNQIMQYKEKIDKLICKDSFKKYYKYFVRTKVQDLFVVNYRILSIDHKIDEVFLFDFEYSCLQDGFVSILQWELALPYDKAMAYIAIHGIKNNSDIEKIVENPEFEYADVFNL